jgi:hypothetical protein
MESKTIWTPQKDDFLRANFGKSPSMLIGECLSCGLSDVQMRAKQLGLL